MKKITLLFAAAAMALSCSNDDDTPVSLDGTWKLTSVIMPEDQIFDKNGDGVASTDFMVEYGYFDNSNLVFGENNTAVFNTQDVAPNTLPLSENVTYTTSGNNVSFYYPTDSETGTLCTTFKRSGNKLTAKLNAEAPYYIPIDGVTGEYYIMFSRSTLVYTKQ
jgi:hypothetical protein